MIRHIVMWRLKDTGTQLEAEEIKAKIANHLMGLKEKIRIINSIEVKSNAPEAPQSNYDLVLNTVFESLADLDIYQNHPAHLEVVDIVKPLVKERAAIDYEF